jgi:hypothetical protein
MRRRIDSSVGSAAVRARAGEASRRSTKPRGVDPTTSQLDYSSDELEFMRAIEDYKKRTGRKFPSWSEVLRIAKGLGYEKPTGRRAASGQSLS